MDDQFATEAATAQSGTVVDWIVHLVLSLASLAGSHNAACLQLAMLDVARAHALVSADATELDAVYADQALRDADAALLDDYVRRGLTLRGAQMHRRSCDVTSADSRQIVVEVVDQLGATWVLDDQGRRRLLPQPREASRTVTLVRDTDRWQIARVVVTR